MNKSKQNTHKMSKGKKRNFKAEDRNEIMKDRPGKNDITWYGSDVLIKAAGNHNFTNPLGKPVDWSFDNSGDVQITLNTNVERGAESVPGVMSLYVEPGIGFCDSAVSPGNVFMRNFYSYIRHQNAGHTNYNAPDLGLYVMAVDQIHIILEHLIRCYGIARTYSSMNRYTPKVFLMAMGVDPDLAGQEMYPNLASIRSNILNLLVKAGTLLVPKDFKLIERHKSLMRYIYSDGSTSKCQTYVFRPQGYKIFKETGPNHTGGYLEYVSMDGIKGIGDWITAANYMIDAVVQSEDMNIMSGDILKAYGSENCYQFMSFAEDYTVVPVYNPEMLLEIHNCVPVGNPHTNAAMDIYQDPMLNIIQYMPIFKSAVPYQSISPILDMPVEVPTPEQVVIATRLVTMGSIGYDSNPGVHYKYVPDSMGSEVVTKIGIFYFRTNNGVWQIEHHEYTGAADESVIADVRFLAHISNFNWHMGIKLMTKTDAHNWLLSGYLGEMENYTPFTEGDLNKLHDTSLIGEFAVPLMAVVGFSGEKKSV